MWNLEKRHKLTYFHSRNRDTDVENKHQTPSGERAWIKWEIEGDVWIMLHV